MLNINEISHELYDICYEVENKIVGQKDLKICDWWGKKNAFRHALTIQSIIDFVISDKKQNVRIFNMSGLSCGHQDFCICYYLRRQGIDFKYYALEHPNSPYLSNPEFLKKVSDFDINIIHGILGDIDNNTIKTNYESPDIILFTEIVEHLDHSTFLHSLQILAEVLSDDGYVILTTPNLDSFDNRIKHLLGKEIDYWGDGIDNLKKGLFGHIAYYNIPRLRRLLADVGFEVYKSSTVNYSHFDPSIKGVSKVWKEIKLSILNTVIALGECSWRAPELMNATKTLGEQIYIEARKSSKKPIPFAL
jgi:hypothetical protein